MTDIFPKSREKSFGRPGKFGAVGGEICLAGALNDFSRRQSIDIVIVMIVALQIKMRQVKLNLFLALPRKSGRIVPQQDLILSDDNHHYHRFVHQVK